MFWIFLFIAYANVLQSFVVNSSNLTNVAVILIGTAMVCHVTNGKH